MNRGWSVIWITVASVGCLILGIFIGRYGLVDDDKASSFHQNIVSSKLMEEIKPENIDRNLKYLAGIPNLAGTPQDLEVATWVRDKFLEGGLDEVHLVPYNILLSFPDKNQPNKVLLVDANNAVQFSTSGRQPQLFAPEEASPHVMPNFNAYSASGTVQGELVYAYYGRKADFDLVEQRGVSVKGKIVIARYGAIFRGNIVNEAEKRGAIGVILFSDPKDFAPEGRDAVYPKQNRLPGLAAQSGSVILGYGDPLTPLYPAIDGAFRLPVEEAPLPKIPVQPIGYDEAEVLLKALSPDNPAPVEWQGSLNISYNLGPTFARPNLSVKLEVRTTNKIATAYNTIGILRGREEPDRYVLIGNHMDAWSLGGIDPASGTAVLIEIARAYGHMKDKKGWRPRRTIVFCGWGAEEHGMIGSYEWAEEHSKVLSQRAVAYINVDSAMEGNYTLRSQTVPSLSSLIREAAKKVPNPNPSEVAAGRKTVYDTWLHTSPDDADPTVPRIGNLGSGSDYTVFSHVLGIPSIDLYYGYKEKIGSYPLYHTLYETYHSVANLMDPGFHYHRAVARLMSEIVLNLSESLVLPLDVLSYGTFLQRDFNNIESRYKAILESNGVTLDYFRRAVSHFRNASEHFTSSILPRVDKHDPLAIRKVNDQLMQVERGFIEPRGLPNRPEFKYTCRLSSVADFLYLLIIHSHIIFSPSAIDKYSSDTFPGLLDLLKQVGNRTEAQEPKMWRQITHHLSVMAFFIQAAGDALNETL